MRDREAACPDEGPLHEFHAGLLPGPEAARIRQHLEGCARCRAELAELSLDELLAGDLRAHFPEGPREPEPGAQPEEPGDRTGSAQAEDPSQVDFSSRVLERLEAHGASAQRYELGDEIARGGMGTILQVWDEDLRRHLAMKVMLGQTTSGSGATPPTRDARTLARFLGEAQITGQLDHPGIVPVHELGLDAKGRVYFTMKLVKGKTLKQVFAELREGTGGWTQTRVLGALLRVCEAMSYAHDKGVIHRDLQPANVMIGRYGEVYVMDWGLAKILGRREQRDIRIQSDAALKTSRLVTERQDLMDSSSDSPLITMDGEVVGTPAYMSPEQAAGLVDAMGPTSDVYALGAMLYHRLAGQPPHVPKDGKIKNYAVWLRVQSDPPEPLGEIAEWAAPELVSISERAMARDALQRYPNMAALAEDLSAYLEGRVVGAYEAGTWAEARKWIERNRALATSIAAAGVLALGGLASTILVRARGRQDAQRSELEAQLQRERANAESFKSLRLSNAKRLGDLLEAADELWPPHPDRIEELETWIDQARALSAGLPEHRASLLEMRAAAEPADSSGQVGVRSSWRFATLDASWQHQVLSELVLELEALEAGLLAESSAGVLGKWSIPDRLFFAQGLELEYEAGGDYERAWAEALPAIAERYPGLDLGGQTGLVPLGPDPDSGLWEFAHLMSGRPAERDGAGHLVLTEDMGTVLVLIPGGSFWMGAQATDPRGRNHDPQALEEEGPPHEVRLSAYFISKYEQTQGQWQRMTGATPSANGPHRRWNEMLFASGAGPSLLQPVEQVSWNECMEWLPRMGLSLPSEAQWECAARAGTDTPYWSGRDLASLEGVANLLDRHAHANGLQAWPGWEREFDDGSTPPAAIGSHRANAFGLHEVHGNVWEWCLDGFGNYDLERRRAPNPVAPLGLDATRSFRGGCYFHSAGNARSARRDGVSPRTAYPYIGLRPARAVDATP